MKKILVLLFVFLFLCSGCYDYREINNLAIVSGISIDYEEDKFQVVFEILNTKNQEKGAEQAKVYYAEGEGNSLSEAFSSTSLEIAKYPYLPHLKTIVVSEEIAKEHVEEIVDFLLRDNYIRDIFYFVIARDATAKDIITKTDTNNPIASSAIQELIESDAFVNNIASKLTYEKFVTNIIDPHKDTYTSSISIENDILKLNSLGVFKDYQLQGYLSEMDSAIFNVMNKTSSEVHLTIPCPDNEENFVVLSTFNSPKSDISLEEDTVKLKTEVETRIIENHCKMDFVEEETYKKIQEKAADVLKNDMKHLGEALKEYDSDILKIGQLYYQKNRKEINFKDLNYEYDAKVIINRNGLIFEVENND